MYLRLQCSFQAAQEKCRVRSLCSARHSGMFILGAENGDLQVWQRDDAAAAARLSRRAQGLAAPPSGASSMGTGAPRCNLGHLCTWSARADGEYVRGWRCNLCHAKRKGERWLCTVCKDDLCFDCFPIHRPGERKTAERDAQVVNGKWVQVRKHSGMGCAVVEFTDPQHRDSLLAQFVREPLVLGGIYIDVKVHMEKQADGTRAEIPGCAFAGWKQPKEEGTCKLRARTLQVYLDRLCSKNAPEPVIALD
mmetsp:Transcript_46724/g.84332  ORF Transcript_46724/g.84332 Transcript_46724/m.84332 type:complete len:250 (+) Transcript_46724:363-1112(+)